MSRYRDRAEAGQVLGALLREHAGRGDVVVLGLPRGGVPVAAEVARALGAPLDVFMVRKLGVPGHEELAMGAIASGGVRILNDRVVEALAIAPELIEQVAERERRELERREKAFRGERPMPPLAGKTVIVVDDGLATGATMRAAVAALGSRHPARLVVAVPVGAPQACTELARHAEVVCARMPHDLGAVGLFYENFGQTTDDEVRAALAAARHAADA